MKITKTFISIFLLTFFIGIIGFYLILKTERNVEQVEITRTVPSDFPAVEIETKIEPKILEENNDWENEEESKFKIKLLETGEGFHGDEIKAKSGETWLGLFKEKNNYYLRFTKIKIRLVEDVVVDEPGQKTGKSVSAGRGNQTFFLLNNAKKLSEGEILTFFGGNPNRNEIEENVDYISLRKGLVKEYEISGQKFLLKVETGENRVGKKILALVLESADKKQVLHSLENLGEDDYLGTLYWVGDLDRDGQPDFYFDLYIHDNVLYKNLFLSSEAERGKLVKKVAVFSTTGC